MEAARFSTLAAHSENGYLLTIMNDNKPEWDEVWQGLEPEQPRSRRGVYWVALAAAIFLMLGACALGYFVLQQRTEPEPGLSLPGDATEVAVQLATEQPATGAATSGPSIAPTVTLPGDFATPPQTGVRMWMAPRRGRYAHHDRWRRDGVGGLAGVFIAPHCLYQ